MSIFFVYTHLRVKTVLFQTIQFHVSTVSMSKTVLFPIIQFIISTLFSSIDRTLSGTIAPCQCGPTNDCNEGVRCIPQSSSITGTPPSYYLVSYLGHSLRGAFPLCCRCILQLQLTGQVPVWVWHSAHDIGNGVNIKLNLSHLTCVTLCVSLWNIFTRHKIKLEMLVGWLVGLLGFMAYQPLLVI